MAFTDNQKGFAYYVIASVESGCNYAAVNQNDPITLGILQWCGQNAYYLLKQVKDEAPDAYEKLSARLRGFADGPAHSWGYWEGIYTKNEDAQSWVEASKLDSCHAVQDRKAYSYLFGEGEGGTYGATSAGGDDVKSRIFLMSVQHQRPASAQQCIAQIGANAGIDRLLQWCLSDRILGAYKNRYKKVHSLLKAWDGQSPAPDFGQTDVDLPNDPSNDYDQSSLKSSVGYIQQVGNDLVVIGAMSSTNRLLCRNTGRGIWVPVQGTNTPNPGGGSPQGGTHPPASPDDPKDFPAMRQLWYANEKKFGYLQGPGRLDPPSSGITDCSACIYWAANAVTNNKYSWIGTWTGAMLKNCPVVWKGSGPIPLDVLRPGDIILFGYANGTTTHVEWYFGDGVVWGAGTNRAASNPHKTTDDVTKVHTIFGKPQLWVCRFLD